MRILMLTQYFHPEPMFKGLPLAKAFRDRGHEVEVLTGFPNYPGGKLYDGYRLRGWQRETIDGLSVIRLPLYPSHNRSAVRRIANYLSFGLTAATIGPWLINKPDVIYIYNLITLGLSSRLIRRRTGCGVVVDVQDLWPESVASSGMMRSKFASNTLTRWCQREYQSADRLIVLSPGFKKNLVARGVPANKIDVIYNWCDETAISIPEPDEATRRDLGFAGKFNIVFAGTMGVAQALDVVIDCARLLSDSCPNVQFTLVGGGIDVERLKAKAVSLSNVQFLPAVPQREIGRVFAHADALLVHLKDDPIFQITVPSKIQAYMYAGKPILCGVKGDAATLVSEAGAGLAFQPQNAQSLADAIRKLCGMSPTELDELGGAGKKYYQDHLAFAAGVTQIEATFRAVRNER